MADLIESARGILSSTQRQMAVTANNVANLTTPGFKSERLYSDLSMGADPLAPQSQQIERLDLSQGRYSRTGNPLDLAIGGSGMFRLRGADGAVSYSRSGEFHLDREGRVVNAQGLVLQSADGDLMLPNSRVRILDNGSVLDGERPIARIPVFAASAAGDLRPLSGSLFTIPEGRVDELPSPDVHQGALEQSNVALADEMVGMMDALRQAESGAKLVQTYDELIGQAITTLGQAR